MLTRSVVPDQMTLNESSVIDGRETCRFAHDAIETLLAFRATAAPCNIHYRLVGVPELATTATH